MKIETISITFRSFKKHCCWRENYPYYANTCDLTQQEELKCCEKNCPVFKEFKKQKEHYDNSNKTPAL